MIFGDQRANRFAGDSSGFTRRRLVLRMGQYFVEARRSLDREQLCQKHVRKKYTRRGKNIDRALITTYNREVIIT
jgi:hypothetical protein